MYDCVNADGWTSLLLTVCPPALPEVTLWDGELLPRIIVASSGGFPVEEVTKGVTCTQCLHASLAHFCVESARL